MRSSIAAIASNTLSRGARCLRTAAILAVLLCVSAPASAAFVDNGDGTISDGVTGLTWDHAPFTSCGGTGAAPRNWQSALTAASTASGCNYRGHNDWRLPNIKELESLVDITRSATAPAVFANGLIGAPSPTTYFWSSTTYPAAQAGVISAFVIFTYDGSFTPLQISNNAYALLVRGGQSFDTLHPPPIVSATSVAPIGYTNATFNATSNAAGAGFVIAVPTGSAAPTTAQVISVAKAGGAGSYTSGTNTVNVIASAFDFLSAGAATAFPLSGFVPATSYDVYFVANDTFGNSSALAGPFTFMTLSNATATAISAINPNPLTFAPGATATVSVSVVRGSDQTAPSGGTVTVSNTTDGTSCTISLPGASACAIPISGAGAKALSAAFVSTDTIHFANSATSGATTLTVNQAPQTIVFGAAPGIAVGGSGTVSASGGASGNPVVFSTTSTACSVAANGAVSGLSVGPCVVTANQAGNADYSSAPPATQTLTVGQASSALGLTSSLASSVFGQAVTFSAVVISANAGAAGTITFTADGSPAPLCPVQPLVGGSANCATTALIAGTHTIAAVYSGDINTTGSSTPALNQSVAKAQTTTTLTAPAPIVFGQSVDVTATVAVKAPGAGTPTGSITISDGGASPGDSCTIALPADHCTLTPGTPANATLTATYVPDSGSSANISGSSATAALTVNPATSSVVLGSSVNPAVFGQSVTLTAVVTTSNPNAGGTVSFSEGGTALTGCGAIAMASGGIAVCQTASLSTGPHALVAAYSGDAATPASSNAASPLSQAVIKASTAVTLTPPGATALGNSISVSATVAVVAPGAGTLTGTITISDGGSAPHDTCTIVLPATQCSLTPSSVGTLTLNASFAPDAAAAANFSGSSASGSLIVSQAASTISLASSDEPAVFGQAITLTAKVSALGPPPTGSVDFSEADGTPIAGCAAVALSTGIANCQTSALSVGTHSLVATYSGDANTVGASSANAPLTQTVDQAATAVTLTAPAPITLGNSVIVSAAVAVVAPGAGTLSGTIAVSDGGSGPGDTCTIVLPAMACSLTPSSAGAKALTATYTPDSVASANFTGSSASGSLTVAAAPSGMSLASSVNPSAFGENVVFTATVTPANGGVPPGGTVTFLDGAAPLCPPTALLPGAASASVTCAAPALAVGNHPISASYSGDANNQPATATLAGGQTVQAAATTTTITPLALITLGTGVAVQVTVAAQAPGAGTPSGTVVVSDGGVTCTATLSNGSGSCTLTPKAPAGVHSISAVYTATANFAMSSGTTSLTVNAATAAMTLTSSANPSAFGQNVTLSAAVKSVVGGAMPTGSITFRDGTTVLCNQVAVTVGGGITTCAVSALAVGNHAISASYSGDDNNQPATATLAGGQTVHAA
ncbi:MAG: Ig-like domain repeat protein, partial [Rudaea sp.]|nr:Ig-like domain repeat protein [Rudaea sp.]